MAEVLQVSKTRLELFAKCQEAYRRRYINGERIPPGIAAVVGTAVDSSVNANLQSKIVTGELMPLEAAKDLARDSLVREWSFGVMFTPEEAAEGISKVKGASVDRSVALAGLHAEKVAPRVEPTHVQRGLAVEMEREGQPISLVTIIDIQEGAKRVRDTKTASKAPSATAAHTSLQLTVEAMAVTVHDGKPPERLSLDFLVGTKSGKVSPHERQTVRGAEDFQSLLNRIDTFVKAHRTGVFSPTSPDNWWCSERWCGYASTCPYFRRPESVVVGEFDLLKQLQKSVEETEK